MPQQRQRDPVSRSSAATAQATFDAPLRSFRQQSSHSTARKPRRHAGRNVGEGERAVSVAAGAILALLGIGRRDATGLLIAGVGGALAYRGATGHCSMYQALGVNTKRDDNAKNAAELGHGIHVNASFLINKPAEQLYAFWRDFQNLPQFMSHLESVSVTDDRRSHWVAKAPAIYGGRVEWDAEITADEPNKKIAWRSLSNADVDHRGAIEFSQALGDRGTKVRVELDYLPPGGRLGHWIAKLFGEEPMQQIHDDLRRFKRLMEVGEIPTTVGQPRGTCLGHGVRET